MPYVGDSACRGNVAFASLATLVGRVTDHVQLLLYCMTPLFSGSIGRLVHIPVPSMLFTARPALPACRRLPGDLYSLAAFSPYLPHFSKGHLWEGRPLYPSPFNVCKA